MLDMKDIASNIAINPFRIEDSKGSQKNSWLHPKCLESNLSLNFSPPKNGFPFLKETPKCVSPKSGSVRFTPLDDSLKS